MLLKADLRSLLERIRDDPAALYARAFWITTKGLPGQESLCRLELNSAQKRIHDAINAQRKAGIPPRIIILKARQPGASTYAAARLMSTALSMPHTTSMIVAHLDDAAERLFGKCKLMEQRMPPDLRPVLRKVRKNEMEFSHYNCQDDTFELGSKIISASAVGKEVWRSLTLHTVHLSEMAYFQNPEAVFTGIMQAVPKGPDSLVIIESTANGEGNAFHTEWKRAEAGESDFIPVFIPWWELEDARLPVTEDFVLDESELRLVKGYGLTKEQLQWRRFTLHTELRGDEVAFDQEYPATADDAFLTTGQPAFPPIVLREMAARARALPARRGMLFSGDGGIRFVDGRQGPLSIYKMPIEGHEYSIGADPASGVEGADYSCAAVYDRISAEIVAVWHGYVSPIAWAAELFTLGTFYNTAILGPEITGGHGMSLIDELKRQFYPRLYVYQRMDKIRNTITNFVGWETNFRTRGLLFDTMHWALSQHEIMIWDMGTIQELREMRYLNAVRAEGQYHDDRAFAAMIALRVHTEMPLASTGAPPRVAFGIETKRQDADVSWPSDNFSRIAWMETERAVRRMRRGSRHLHAEWFASPEDQLEDNEDLTMEPWTPENLY